ncbi:MAG: hypothetical protein ACE5FO_08595 [Parvularculaceae bacterium]
MPDAGILGSVLVAAVGALVGAVIQRLISRRQQQYRATLDLFRQYNMQEMIDARAAAWKFLRVDYTESDAPISAFYADAGRPELAKIYGDITKVAIFWHLLYIMHREKELLRGLAKEMFGRQFADWETVLLPLARNTKQHDEDVPEWATILLKNKLSWLK